MPGYRGGHILRIKVINFMTYDELEIFPKHGLNLIVGLNGSGKSSIMCAVCLGLAGKPQFTGRQVHLSDFIKYGCDKATIEIELDNHPKRNVVITRIIQGDKSTWILNRSPVPLIEIQNIVKKFNIDIGNLCQFLPQEKVAEFAKMDKKARLENMLQAIGEPHLYESFQELKRMKVSSGKLEEEIKSHEKNKNSEGEKNERLKIDVDKHEERLRLKENLKSLEQHKKYLDYEDMRKQSAEIKKDLQPLVKLSETQKNQVTEFTDKLKTKNSFILGNFEELKNAKKNTSVLQGKITECETKLSSYHDTAQNAKIHYQNRIEEKRNQKEKLSEIKQQIQGLEKLIQKSAIEQPKMEERDRELTQRLEGIKNHLSQLNSSHAYINMEKNKREYNIKSHLREIESLKNLENKKLEVLRQRFPDVYEGVKWLEENKDQFRRPIYKPMLISLKIENEDYCKFLEHSIAPRDLVAFVCEDKEDNKKLTQILRVHKQLKVNIVMVPDKPLEAYQSLKVTQELRQLGIVCFLRDIFQAPDGIMRFLCQCYNVHRIPLCTAVAERNTDAIFDRFQRFYLPDKVFSGKRSKYGARNFTSRQDPIRGNKLIPSSKDTSERMQMLVTKTQELQREVSAFQEKLGELDKEMKINEREENSLREEKRALSEKLKEVQNLERQFNQKSQSYERKKNDLVNEEYEKRVLVKNIQETNARKSFVLKELATCSQDFAAYKKVQLICNLKARLLKKNLIKLQRLVREKEEQQRATERKIEELSVARAQIKAKGLALRDEILQMHGSGEIENKRVTSAGDDCSLPSFPESILKTMFKPCGLSREDTEKEIRRAQAQLEINSEENESVRVEYYQRKQRIEEMEKDISTISAQLKKLQTDICNKKNEWLPALEKHIRSINGKFSQYYKQLKCAGEISLDTCNNSDDFPKYGLQITLKYRDNEPFMELSNTHHSGGECSVAAIIFILSLQELTEVPFRCIDEINQGMDAQNERSIYNLISDSAKSGSCSQYFLLTPKLLMDLEMIEHKDVCVHIIFNSPFLDMNMDVQKHIELFDGE